MADDYEEVGLDLVHLTTYLELLAPTRTLGSTHVRRFRWTGPTDDWFDTRTNHVAYPTFRTLLESEAARSALPQILDPSPFPLGTPPDFDGVAGGPLLLDGELAALLVRGGAYERFRGTHREAKAIAVAAARDLIDDRYEDFEVFHSYRAWSPWFFDNAWDQTWLLVDRRDAEVTLICTTDTD